MIRIELKKAYNNLDLDDNKNKLSDELLVIAKLLNTIENIYGLVPNFKIMNQVQL